MIKVENIDIWGFDHAIRGMRNPMNSWDKSDSGYGLDGEDEDVFVIGPNDLELMRKLYLAGPEHRKYLRQIFVSMDITAPLYWISEFDTYKIGVSRNSCSFMHKGVSKKFEITDFSVHNDEVYKILSPLEKKVYELKYPYETNEYKIYTTESGRRYEVYKNGRIMALPFEYTDSLGRTRNFDKREVIPTQTPCGYFELNLGGRNAEKWLLHRLVAYVWIDNPDKLTTVNHINGDKGNNSVENLEWCTLQENIAHGFDNGFYERGKSSHAGYLKWKNGHRKVDVLTKRHIISSYKNGVSCQDLSKKYELPIHTVYNLLFQEASPNAHLYSMCYYWEQTIKELNRLRDLYLETKDLDYFQQIRCLLPCGYNQRFTITMNYENVVSMIRQRTGHKLDEWNNFVEELRSLPYVEEITKE